MIGKILARLRPKAPAPDHHAADPLAAQHETVRKQRVSSLLDDFTKRLRGGGSAKTEGLVHVAAGAKPFVTPARAGLRSMNQWLDLLGLLGIACLVIWVMSSSWSLVSASRGLEHHVLPIPKLSQFPIMERKALLTVDRLSPELQLAMTPDEDRLLRAIRNVATFENARAEQTLRATRAEVQAVVEGSAAELAKVEVGDVIKQVSGKPAGYVWDVYKTMSDRPLRLLELNVLRGTELLNLTLSLKEGDTFDMSNHGLLFPVPQHVRYIGQTDAARLSDQLRSAYVDTVPQEWRRSYVEGLLVVSNELVGNLTRLSGTAYNAPDYLRIEDLLVWYHNKFNESLTQYRIGDDRMRARQTSALLQIGWGLLAGGLAMLFALALKARNRWAE